MAIDGEPNLAIWAVAALLTLGGGIMGAAAAWSWLAERYWPETSETEAAGAITVLLSAGRWRMTWIRDGSRRTLDIGRVPNDATNDPQSNDQRGDSG